MPLTRATYGAGALANLARGEAHRTDKGKGFVSGQPRVGLDDAQVGPVAEGAIDIRNIVGGRLRGTVVLVIANEKIAGGLVLAIAARPIGRSTVRT